MSYIGEFDLEYQNKSEEKLFIRTRRLNGFHVSLVKQYYAEDSWKSITGTDGWNAPEPKGRGKMGNWGFDLRYATLDHWYRDGAIEKGRFTRDEVDNFWAAWKGSCSVKRPLSHAEILEHWRNNRKDKSEARATNQRKKARRRTVAWQEKFQAERDPSKIYRRLIATLPTASIMDEQVIRSFSRMLAEANDILWQAEQLKVEDGVVPEERLQDYTKLMDLNHKIQKQVTDLLKGHGYDYQARRARREAQTAAEVFDDVVEDAAVLFDNRAREMICPKCNLSLAYFAREFPTVEFTLSTPGCPRCDKPFAVTMEAMPDEVIDA